MTDDPRTGPATRQRRASPGPTWLGTAVLVVALLELVLGVVGLVLGATAAGLALLSSGLVIATLTAGLRITR